MTRREANAEELARRAEAYRRAQHPAGTLPLESLPLLLDALPASCRPAPSGYPAVRALLDASPRRDVLSAAIEVRLGEGQRRRG